MILNRSLVGKFFQTWQPCLQCWIVPGITTPQFFSNKWAGLVSVFWTQNIAITIVKEDKHIDFDFFFFVNYDLLTSPCCVLFWISLSICGFQGKETATWIKKAPAQVKQVYLKVQDFHYDGTALDLWYPIFTLKTWNHAILLDIDVSVLLSSFSAYKNLYREVWKLGKLVERVKLKNYSSFYFNTKSHYLKLCLVSI